jgi:hypothetical protein
MNKLFFCLVLICTFENRAFSQSPDSVRYIDSLMAKRKTGLLPGSVPTHYTPGYRSWALQVQQEFEQAAAYYRKYYHREFHLKLAVLDSTQWIKERIRFGYLAYEDGWAYIPAQLDYNFFLHVYGLEQQRPQLEALLKKHQLSHQQMMHSLFLLFALHELGHYFILDLNGCETPDNFADELIATYFSYNYLQSIHSTNAKNTLIFSKFFTSTYRPEYRRIEDMDTLFSHMSIQNFKWFHCNILLLCKQIYPTSGREFISNYLKIFAKGTKTNYGTAELIALLDKEEKGTIKKWADNLPLH